MPRPMKYISVEWAYLFYTNTEIDTLTSFSISKNNFNGSTISLVYNKSSMNINLCERIVLHFLNWACGHIVNFESCLILNIHLCWSLSEYIHFIFMRNIFLEKEFIVCSTGFLGEFEKQTKYKINKKRENFKNCSRTHFFFFKNLHFKYPVFTEYLQRPSLATISR